MAVVQKPIGWISARENTDFNAATIANHFMSSQMQSHPASALAAAVNFGNTDMAASTTLIIVFIILSLLQ